MTYEQLDKVMPDPPVPCRALVTPYPRFGEPRTVMLIYYRSIKILGMIEDGEMYGFSDISQIKKIEILEGLS